jgi:sporulation protein YlmC with PRC-barrel domain
MDAKTLNDVAVVSVSEAARLGRVTDVLFETEPLRAAALKASDGSSQFVVPLDQVSSFGTDAVMVESPDVTELSRRGGSFGHLRTLNELQKLKIVDQAGTFVGTIRTVDFDPDNGRIERLFAETGGVFGIGRTSTTIEGQAVRSVGADLVTIASSSDAPGSAE